MSVPTKTTLGRRWRVGWGVEIRGPKSADNVGIAAVCHSLLTSPEEVWRDMSNFRISRGHKVDGKVRKSTSKRTMIKMPPGFQQIGGKPD